MGGYWVLSLQLNHHHRRKTHFFAAISLVSVHPLILHRKLCLKLMLPVNYLFLLSYNLEDFVNGNY